MTNGTQQNYPAWVKAYERRRALRATANGILCVLLGLVIGLLLSSCATVGSVVPRVGQEQAVHIIWVEVYGRTDRPPLVRWYTGDQLTCTDPDSGKPGIQMGAECREGWTWSPVEVLVSYHGETSLSETALAHEFLHALLLREGVWLESHHDRPDFYPRIDVANAAIIQAGR